MGALVKIAALAMASDVSWAVTVSDDGTARTLGTGAAPRVLRRAVPIDGQQPMAVSLVAGRLIRIVWAAGDGLGVFENDRGAWPRNEVFAAPAVITALAFAPSGRIAMLGCDDGTLLRFDAASGTFGETLTTGTSYARALAMASDDGPVAVCLEDGTTYRLDLRTGNALAVGTGLNASRVAITPDGGIVLTHGADGILRRWDLSRGGMPATHRLDSAVTALAVDGTGNQVTAGGADGRLWLHDLTTGRVTPFGQAERSRPGAGPPGPDAIDAEEAPEQDAIDAAESAGPAAIVAQSSPEPVPAVVQDSPEPGGVVDDDVSFTVYRPRYLSPGVWASLLVFAHKTDPVVDLERGPVDPVKEVERRAQEALGPDVPAPARTDALSGLSRGARLRIAVDLPGVRCNPAETELDWWEPVHEVGFRLLAGPDLTGAVVRGAVRFWCGPLLVGEVSLAISVRAAGGPDEAPVAERAPMYRKIFPSYSHRDHAIVQGFEDAARALGDRYLQDVLALRAGERWQPRLLELIAEADVFQLFWSTNSMRSQYCQQEWEHALALGRPFFVRPLYWEDPLPEDMALGLPPAGLRQIHFIRVGSGSRQPSPGTNPGLTRHDTGLLPPPLAGLLVWTRNSDYRIGPGTTYSIGRDPDADIVMTDSRVSWKHGVLRIDDGQWIFEDISRNGTFLGSERIDRVAVGNDCVLRLGSVEDGPILRCTAETASAPSPVTPGHAATGLTEIVPRDPAAPAGPADPLPSEEGPWWQNPSPYGQGAPIPQGPGPQGPGPQDRVPAAGGGPVAQGSPYDASWGAAGSAQGYGQGNGQGYWAPTGAPPRGRSPRRAVLIAGAAAIIVAVAVVVILVFVLH